MSFTPSRAAGLESMRVFLPGAGHDYARGRNRDLGPERSAVSRLSPYIRHRLIAEEEVIRAAWDAHGQAAEKFIEEVFWRTYWKGWLELRPGVWRRYKAELARANGDDARVMAAVNGRTGIACFDHWAQELRETGYLHNHARMWFASIWIFTLRLPWVLGADFFMQHLLDADPASNTLSWRWVAGLHTRGKHYLARAENIRLNTGGRFDPSGELDEAALPLAEAAPEETIHPIPAGGSFLSGRAALLLTPEDLQAESWTIGGEVQAVLGLAVGKPVTRQALEDGMARAASHYGAPIRGTLEGHEIAGWCAREGIARLVTAYAPVGGTADALASIGGVEIVQLQRPYDSRAWPHARAGFFRFRQAIPELVRAIAAV